MLLPYNLTPEDRIVYLHIPKTAGTSVNHYFQRLLGPENVGWFGVDFGPDELAKGEGLERFKVIGGHFSKNKAVSIPGPKVYLSAVREPRARAISYYKYVLSVPDERERLRLTGSMLADIEGTFGQDLNGQMRWFLGDWRDDGRFGFATVDRLDDLLRFVAGRLGKEHIAVPRENIGAGVEPEMSPALLARLDELTAPDAELFRSIANRDA